MLRKQQEVLITDIAISILVRYKILGFRQHATAPEGNREERKDESVPHTY